MWALQGVPRLGASRASSDDRADARCLADFLWCWSSGLCTGLDSVVKFCEWQCTVVVTNKIELSVCPLTVCEGSNTVLYFALS